MQLGEKFKIKKFHLLLGSLLLLVLTLLYWLYTKLEWEEKEIDLGYSSEARQNPFLAAELFLRTQGVTVTRVNNVSLLEKHSWRELNLEPQDTILLVNGYKTLTNESYDKITAWIENGGNFIISAQNPFIGSHTANEDLLLAEFEIEPTKKEKTDKKNSFLKKIAEEVKKQKENKKEKKEEEKESLSVKQQDTCSEQEKTVAIPFGGETEPLYFDFLDSPPLQRLSHSDEVDEESDEVDEELNEPSEEDQESSPEKKHLFYFNWGEGSVTFISDEYLWSNQRIQCHDHAYGLWRLINPDSRVWILVNQDAPSLAAILWRYTPFALISCGLALVFWLWSSSQIFGPVQPITQTQRRSLAEHLHASAMLLWRRQQQVQLLKKLRHSILQHVDHLPEVSIQSNKVQTDQEKLEYLLTLSNIPKKQLEKALFSEELEHPQEFINAVICLQSLVTLHLSKKIE